jgi:hypothetical protein
MRIKDVKKGDWIINTKIPESAPWWVCCKYTGMIAIRRAPKKGKLTALTSRQLCALEKVDYLKFMVEKLYGVKK